MYKRQAYSIEPAEVSGLQITKSVNGESGDKKSSDTMGTKHRVDFGIYVFKGSINCQLAEKTGFSEEDAEVIKEALRLSLIHISFFIHEDPPFHLSFL